jgi:RimJ/RimL family protein N-acetyltransferase
MGTNLRLGPYNEVCLEKSWFWLNDAEIKRLTMTSDFTREDQMRFFESLPRRSDYLIWSVLFDDELIGAAGLKNHRSGTAEYWGYIGEKDYWNKGLGRCLVRVVQEKARLAGFHTLDLKVYATNVRAIRLYEKCGFIVDPARTTTTCLCMVKRGLS